MPRVSAASGRKRTLLNVRSGNWRRATHLDGKRTSMQRHIDRTLSESSAIRTEAEPRERRKRSLRFARHSPGVHCKHPRTPFVVNFRLRTIQELGTTAGFSRTIVLSRIGMRALSLQLGVHALAGDEDCGCCSIAESLVVAGTLDRSVIIDKEVLMNAKRHE